MYDDRDGCGPPGDQPEDGYEAVSDLPPVIKRTSPGYGSYLFDQA